MPYALAGDAGLGHAAALLQVPNPAARLGSKPLRLLAPLENSPRCHPCCISRFPLPLLFVTYSSELAISPYSPGLHLLTEIAAFPELDIV